MRTILKKLLGIVVLCFFCSNVAFSKPEMYYCIEEGSTGFKPDGKDGYKRTNWVEDKFKAKIDFDFEESSEKCYTLNGC